MQLFKLKNNKSLLKTILLTMVAFSFTTSFNFSDQPLVQTAYASEVDYRASSNAIEMKTMNYSKVDTSAIKEGNFNVYVNSNKVNLTDKILVVNGNSFLPLRAIGDAIGATTSWDASSKIAKIEFTNYGKVTTSIEMSSDCTKMLVNGTTTVNVSNQNTSTATFIDPSTSRIYLPVRAISENLEGVQIEYFSTTRTISITTNGAIPIDPSVDITTPSPNIEKPGEGGEVRENPPVVVENGDDVFRGEKKPDYKGKVDMEKSPGGNWEWWEAKGIWTEYTGGSFVIDMSDINFDE
ncbi:MAG: hypothetical protein HFE58_13210 [Firmicutes bacterium]|nr:hypothetical protein [Bacillota bacterium]